MWVGCFPLLQGGSLLPKEDTVKGWEEPYRPKATGWLWYEDREGGEQLRGHGAQGQGEGPKLGQDHDAPVLE